MSSLRAGRSTVTMRLPFAAPSVAQARHELKSWMHDAGSSREEIDDALIVISELVGNSVRHARPLPGGDLLVTWTVRGRGLELSVTDGGSVTRPRRMHAPSSALAGRGMAIVENLAHTWWTDRSRSRSTVHAILSV